LLNAASVAQADSAAATPVAANAALETVSGDSNVDETASPGTRGARGAQDADHRDPASDEAVAAGELAAQAAWILAAVPTAPVPVATDAGASIDAAVGRQTAANSLAGAPAKGSGPAQTLATDDFAQAIAGSRQTPPSALGATAAAMPDTPATRITAASARIVSAAMTVNSDSAALTSSGGLSSANGDASGKDSQSSLSDSAGGPDLAALASLLRDVAPGTAATDGAGRHIALPVFDSAWPRAVAAQVQMLATANVQNATLRLSPEHLGPIEVHIDLQASQINVNFVAAHPDTRGALEQSLPTLRAMLAQGGLTLGQAQVQGETRSGSHSAPARPRNTTVDTVEAPVSIAATHSVGLIDEYA
jgi:flagellar hook-length control protein FliK